MVPLSQLVTLPSALARDIYILQQYGLTTYNYMCVCQSVMLWNAIVPPTHMCKGYNL
jgi:hypothetical protein